MKAYSLIASLLMLVSFSVTAGPLSKRILISVGDLKDNKSKEWKKSICLQVYTIGNQVVQNGSNVTCREFSTDNFYDKELQQLSSQYDYHLRIMILKLWAGISITQKIQK